MIENYTLTKNFLVGSFYQVKVTLLDIFGASFLDYLNEQNCLV